MDKFINMSKMTILFNLERYLVLKVVDKGEEKEDEEKDADMAALGDAPTDVI